MQNNTGKMTIDEIKENFPKEFYILQLICKSEQQIIDGIDFIIKNIATIYDVKNYFVTFGEIPNKNVAKCLNAGISMEIILDDLRSMKIRKYFSIL